MLPHALLLAAGTGIRFGSNKLLALWRGRPLVGHQSPSSPSLRDRGIATGATAVVRAGDDPVAGLLRQAGVRLVLNDQPELGLAHSLRLGLGALAAMTPPPEAALVFLADQPSAPRRGGRRGSRAPGSWAAAPSSGHATPETPDEPGHPVLLDRDAWGLAERLTGDQGLGRVLSAPPELVVHVDVEGPTPTSTSPADLSRLGPSPR